MNKSVCLKLFVCCCIFFSDDLHAQTNSHTNEIKPQHNLSKDRYLSNDKKASGSENTSLQKHHQHLNISQELAQTTAMNEAIANHAPASDIVRMIENGANVFHRERMSNKTPLHEAAKHEDYLDVVKALIKRGADVNAKTQSGYSPLYYADSSNIEIARTLIENGANVNETTARNGETPLMHLASVSPNPDIVNLLIENKADINAVAKNGSPVLAFVSDYRSSSPKSIDSRNPENIKRLLKFGCNPDSANTKDGTTALMYAINSENKEIISILLDAGADRVIADKDGNIPLSYGLLCANSLEITRLLLQKECDINAQNNEGNTALLLAAYTTDNPELIDLLIEHGADISITDKWKNSALICAAEKNTNPLIIAALIDKGLPIDRGNGIDTTPLMNAVSYNPNSEIAELLLEKGASVNKKTKYGKTALMNAAQFSHPERVSMLLKRGALINAKDNQGNNALICAVKFSKSIQPPKPDRTKPGLLDDDKTSSNSQKRSPSYKIIQILLDNGADIKVTDSKKNNLLCALFEFPSPTDPDVLKLLIEKGVDVNEANNLGRTPLYKALVWSADVSIISILLANGAKIDHKDEFDESITDVALKAKNAKELIPLLQKHGKPEANSEVMIIEAARNCKNPEILQSIVSSGADIKAFNQHGENLVTVAAKNNNPEVLKYVLSLALDANMANKDGFTPLMISADNCNLINAAILLEYGAKISSPGQQVDYSEISLAANSGKKTENRIAMLDFLFQNGAKLSTAKDAYGKLLSELAERDESAEVILSLVKHGADINSRNPQEKTPLISAAINTRYGKTVIAELLDAGADATLMDDNCSRAYDYAEIFQGKQISDPVFLRLEKECAKLDNNLK